MPLDAVDAEKLATDLWRPWEENREKSLEWQRWALGQQELPVANDTSNREHRSLQEKSITPWLGLIVQSLAQALIVEGYRTAGADDDNLLWSVWQANNMDAKQVGIYEASMTTGISYVAVLPTDMPLARTRPEVTDAAGKKMTVPEWRAYPSTMMTGFYESPYDDWPTFALAAEPEPMWQQQLGQNARWRLTLFDADAVYLMTKTDGGNAVLQDVREHQMGVTPVVAYINRQTLTGRALGEVEPYTAVASRIDQDVFDRLVTQRFAAWKDRWATGLVIPPTPEEEDAQELSLKQSDILTSDSIDTKFGTLAETPLDGHLRAPIEDVKMLSAVSQTPPTHLTGDLSNISAEALAALEAAYNRKVEQRKVTFGEAHERCFRLSAGLMGAEVDPQAQVRWADLESRSLAQTADALGKLAQMLQIPVEVLWDKVTILTDQDRERAKELRTQEGTDTFGRLLGELERGNTPGAPAEPALNV